MRMLSSDQVGALIRSGYGKGFQDAQVEPLSQGEVVSHTAKLWRVRTPQGDDYVAKLLPANTWRHATFDNTKFALLTFCAARGVPVPPIVRDAAGAVWHRRGLLAVELSRFVEGRPLGFDARAVDTYLQATHTLRRALDRAPETLSVAIGGVPVLHFVDEPDPVRAQVEGLELLRRAQVCDDDRWAALALEQLALLARIPPHVLAQQVSAPRRAVVHADLHRAHLLATAQDPGEMAAVLDFDNVTVGDPALDLAWLCDQAAMADAQGAPDLTLLAHVVAGIVARRMARVEDLVRGLWALVAYAIPIVVDIAKDILVRNDVREVWRSYLGILDLNRKLTLLRELS